MTLKTAMVGTSDKKGILDSRNFFVSILTLIFLPFVDNGLELPATAAEASGEIVDAILSGNVTVIIGAVLPNLINPIMKLFQNGWTGWSWAFLRSANFWTQALTVAILVLTGYGFMFPDGAADNLISAIFGGQFNAISVAIVINVINPAYHFIKTLSSKE